MWHENFQGPVKVQKGSVPTMAEERISALKKRIIAQRTREDGKALEIHWAIVGTAPFFL
jgi:hypothetical protein